jgi:three-Cys-motif partner protein
MAVNQFFDKRSEQSTKKIRIVSKFFASWANVMLNTARNNGRNIDSIRLGFVDPFAGPGRYKDNTPATPIRILEHTLSDSELRGTVVCQFNDVNQVFADTLSKEIESLPGIEQLKYKPVVTNRAIENFDTKFLTSAGRYYPTLYYFDPWGYKGLTLDLIRQSIEPFGCDCVFFFNFNRINAAITNPQFKPHVDALFGVERAEDLRRRIGYCRTPTQRRDLIVETLKEALKSVHGKYSKEFLFRTDNGHPSHFIIMTSKSVKAYDIMKTIMANESTGLYSEVPNFGHDPLDEYQKNAPSLFGDLDFKIEDLKERILSEFKGQSVTFGTLFIRHNVGTNFIRKNYSNAILELEEQKKIEVFPPATERKRGSRVTCSDDVLIVFP